MNIHSMDRLGAERWDRFVDAHPSASVYHTTRWREVLVRSFPGDTVYLYSEECGKILGILPMFYQQSRLFGKRAVALPFCSYGGVCAVGDDVEQQLLREACRIVEEREGDYLEIRDPQMTEVSYPSGLRWRTVTSKVTMCLPLARASEEIFRSLNSNLRRKIRKAERNGLRMKINHVGKLADFYSIYSRNMRDLGTPVYPIRFIANILELFPREASICVVYLDGGVVATALTMRWRDQVEVLLASSIRTYNHLYPNEFMYWHLIEWACQTRCKVFDFGRSTVGSGTHLFKKHWNPEEVPLRWRYWYRREDANPPQKENPRYRLLQAGWRKMPLWLANRVGPWISRSLY